LRITHLNTDPRGHIGAKVRAHLQQCYFNKPIRPRALGNASNFSAREWERVMLDLVVTHWVRLVSALIGGPAGLKGAEDARHAAEAKAAEDARRAAEAKAAEDARHAAEAKAAEDARHAAKANAAKETRGGTKAKAAKEPRRTAEAKATKEARGGAKAKATKEPRRAAEAKAAEDASGVAKSKAAGGRKVPPQPIQAKGRRKWLHHRPFSGSSRDRSEAEDTTCLAETNAADEGGKMILCARASSTFGAAPIA
jgi:hypothetical protein